MFNKVDGIKELIGVMIPKYKRRFNLEYTKQYMVKPFLHNILGWNVFNIDCVVDCSRTVTCTRKLDIELRKDDKIVTMIECRAMGESVVIFDKEIKGRSDSRIYSYLDVMDYGIYIVTNGLKYAFYVFDKEKRVLADYAAYELNLENIGATDLDFLDMLCYGNFDGETFYNKLFEYEKRLALERKYMEALCQAKLVYEKVAMPEIPFEQFAAGLIGITKEEVLELRNCELKNNSKVVSEVLTEAKKTAVIDVGSDSIVAARAGYFLKRVPENSEKVTISEKPDMKWRKAVLQSDKLPPLVELTAKSKKRGNVKVFFEPKTQKSVVCVGTRVQSYKVDNESRSGFQYSRWLDLFKNHCNNEGICKKAVSFTRISAAAEFIEGIPYKNGFEYFRVIGTDLTLNQWLEGWARELGIITVE